MPAEGIKLISHQDILTFEEIEIIARRCAELGVDKIRITGGEPLVRKGIIRLVEMIAKIPGIRDLSMTTNGTLLDQFAHELARAGLMRVNISLDTVSGERYHKITRVGDLESVLSGIREAKAAGLNPVKINCVIRESPEEKDAVDVAEFCKWNNLEVRFIREMNLNTGKFSKVIGGEGGHCASCNRLRLTADGKIKPCLFSDIEFSIRELGIDEAVQMALGLKPFRGSENRVNSFCNIGG